MRNHRWFQLAVVMATVGGLMATGSTGVAAADAPTVSYSPSTNLSDGQTVEITGEHLVPGQTVHAYECQLYGTLCTKNLMASAIVDGSGRARVTVQVVRHIRDYMDDYGDLPMDCAVQTCLLALALEGGDYEDGYFPVATTVLHFAPEPALFTAPARVYEANTGTHTVSVPFALSPATDRPRAVRYRTVAWSAEADDFVPASGRILIPAGQTTATVDVAVYGDTTVETDEVFLVELRGRGSARGTHAFGVATILNDD